MHKPEVQAHIPEPPVPGLSGRTARYPRSGAFLMSPRRISAVFPGPLSFARQTLGELQRLGSRLTRLRLDIDADGRGTALYRFTVGATDLHYLVVSNALAEEEKTDHNTGEVWDVMSALVCGPWTAEREADLLRELPKQRNGRPDADTLVYARGNRSGRLFDHVVESLAAGRQPDPDRLSAIGYIVRTTSFVGNGLLGMRSFEGYGESHPLRRPYHAQLCAAFLLREFVCDLVDAIAAARSGNAAARLDSSFRRALGLGNSAGPGLVYFTANHPKLIHHWIRIQEEALTRARARPLEPGHVEEFRGLLARAAVYFAQSYPDRNGIYCDPARLSVEMETLADRLSAPVQAADCGELCDHLCQDVSLEAAEVVDMILLEICPDIVADYLDAFVTDETLAVDPVMDLGRLKQIIATDYGWALEADRHAGDRRLFWYRSEDAPGDSRRGLRGVIAGIEHETPLDVVMKVAELARALSDCPDRETVGHFLLSRPEYSYVVSRVQTLAGLDTAEYRADYTHPDFQRLIPPRLILNFYGMEKLDTHLPRSVRGVLLQGAPTADDLAAGRPGTWPFPIFPGAGRASPAAPREARIAVREAAIGNDTASKAVKPPGRKRRYVDTSGRADNHIRVSPVELGRALQKSLQGVGMSLGDSIQAAELVMLGEAMGRSAVASCLEQIEVFPGSIDWRRAPALQPAVLPSLDLAGRAAIADMPRIGYFLAAEARLRGCSGIVARRTFGMTVLDALAFRLAESGLAVLLGWRANGNFAEQAGATYAAVAFPAAGGAGMFELAVQPAGANSAEPGAWAELVARADPGQIAAFAASAISALAPGDYAIFAASVDKAAAPAGAPPACDSDTVARTRKAGLTCGIPLPRAQFEKVMLLSERVRVPSALEEFIAAG